VSCEWRTISREERRSKRCEPLAVPALPTGFVIPFERFGKTHSMMLMATERWTDIWAIFVCGASGEGSLGFALDARRCGVLFI
jgi:hypothetical protein